MTPLAPPTPQTAEPPTPQVAASPLQVLNAAIEDFHHHTAGNPAMRHVKSHLSDAQRAAAQVPLHHDHAVGYQPPGKPGRLVREKVHQTFSQALQAGTAPQSGGMSGIGTA